MTKNFKQKLMTASAAGFIGLVSGVEQSHANTFNDVLANLNASISDFPGLITGVAYMMGILFGVLGILKIKDHVENPGQTPLQQGAIRLAAGGSFFALPMIYESMTETIGSAGTGPTVTTVDAIDMSVN